jgi:hypothetical protein
MDGTLTNLPNELFHICGNFMSETIKADVMKSRFKYFWRKYEKITYKIYIPINEYKKYNIEKMHQIIVLIYKILDNIKKFDNVININIVLIDVKKELGDGIVTANEVNSGCTSRYKNSEIKIAIWRKEEVFKVLIHELIHALGIDNVDESCAKDIKEKYNIAENPPLLFEAYTELIALIINSHICHYLSENKQIENIPIKIDLITLKNILLDEFKFSLIQLRKILHNGRNLFREFVQHTNTFSYYALKSILLYYHLFFGYDVFNDKRICRLLNDDFVRNHKEFIKKYIEANRGVEYNRSLRMTMPTHDILINIL